MRDKGDREFQDQYILFKVDWGNNSTAQLALQGRTIKSICPTSSVAQFLLQLIEWIRLWYLFGGGKDLLLFLIISLLPFLFLFEKIHRGRHKRPFKHKHMSRHSTGLIIIDVRFYNISLYVFLYKDFRINSCRNYSFLIVLEQHHQSNFLWPWISSINFRFMLAEYHAEV